ncbi:MAG: VWA domain-containing protein, partial [bacterium]|nr:VWA domain-containing protein [bacterium]
NTEEYDLIRDNAFKDTLQNPLSTFSIDVDTASYSNLRRFIGRNQMPPKDAVRIEEMINYFDYDYPSPQGQHPFSLNTEIGPCPWNAEHRLVHIGLQGKKPDDTPRRSNLVFLIDSSGSMDEPSKLPLLKQSFKLLLEQLGENDRISIVAYAGSAGVVLPATPASQQKKILAALESLQAGGSTAGGQGIGLAYELAMQNFIRGGNNRVILATDGDFNVGVSSSAELVRLVEEKRKGGVYLTILGFGGGNYKDGRMEQISKAGNGNYFYIDTIREAEKVFVRDMQANLFTIAGDVKMQVEFNPEHVAAWRLIGYENRVMAREDFEDDQKDAGELGAGHSVTALYEIVPPGAKSSVKTGAPLKYQKPVQKKTAGYAKELMTLKLRYKPLGSKTSKLLEQPVPATALSLGQTSDNFRFSAAVAAFGMLLRDSEFKGDASYVATERLARGAKGKDEYGLREEFIRMVESCRLMAK